MTYPNVRLVWLTAALATLACSKSKPPEKTRLPPVATASASPQTDASSPDTGAAPSSPPNADAGVTPPETPAGLAARFCTALPRTQRRLLAAAWADLDGPGLFPRRAKVEVERKSEPERDEKVPRDDGTFADAGAPAAPVDGGAQSDAGTPTSPVDAKPPVVDPAALDAVTGVPELPQWLGECRATPSGAWTLLVDEVERESEDLKGTWAIGHVDRKGHLLAARLSLFAYTQWDASHDELVLGNDSRGDFSLLDSTHRRLEIVGSTFDWDGDTEPEFLVNVWIQITPPLRGISRGRIWTYRDGVVRLYGPTRNLNVVSARDIDADGRDDLEVYVGGGTYVSRTDSRWMVTDSLNLVAHSLPNGKFSFTDDVAIGYAKKVCKPPGKALSTQVEVLCARVWGASPEAITIAIQRGCKHPEPGSECEDLDAMNGLAEMPVPVVIPKAQRE